ncbi:hypothetical protein Rhal01_03411 [Rubritalea halochordaticola]|uniref:Uncharacterized protein n=1 Tax=Rubritalea halochordaticola TaxID=714537 RepID=A0ABP9V3W3_9BACT
MEMPPELGVYELHPGGVMESSAAVSFLVQAPPREPDTPTQATPEGWWKEWSSKANRIREDAACLSIGNCLSFTTKMLTRRILKIIRLYCVLLVSIVKTVGAAPELVVDGGSISWKDVFDAGFKPKHIQGLESAAVSYNKSFRIKNASTGEYCTFLEGRTKFSFLKGNKLQSIWYSASTSISRSDVIILADSFEKVFSEAIEEPFNAPDEVYDPNRYPNGLPKYKVVAKINGHKFILSFRHVSGFPESFTAHFVYDADNPNKMSVKYLFKDKVKPPEGYEDYDIVHGVYPDDEKVSQSKVQKTADRQQDVVLREETNPNDKLGKHDESQPKSRYLLALALLIILTLLFYIFRK